MPKCELVQWTILTLVPGCCQPSNPFGPYYAGVKLVTPADTTNGAAFPFQVPSGRWLGIGTVEVSSKLYYMDDAARGSYFHLSFVPLTPTTGDAMRASLLLSVPTTAPYMRFDPPLAVEPGRIVHADFLNNAQAEQYMAATLTGWLSSDQTFAACR